MSAEPSRSEGHGGSREVLTTAVVHQWQCDHFGHLNVRHYAALFDDSSFVFWSRHGVGGDDPVVPVTADLRITFSAELRAGAIVTIRSHVVRVGSKSVTIRFELVQTGTDEIAATCDTVEVFFDRQRRTSELIPAPVRDSLARSASDREGGPSAPRSTTPVQADRRLET